MPPSLFPEKSIEILLMLSTCTVSATVLKIPRRFLKKIQAVCSFLSDLFFPIGHRNSFPFIEVIRETCDN